MRTNLGPEPSYCKGLSGKPLPPTEWATCWKYGWNESTNTLARIGYDFGHNVLPMLIAVAVIAFAVIIVVSSLGKTWQ